MKSLDSELDKRLSLLDETHLRRELRVIDSAQGAVVSIQGRRLVNFSSNDYLGLASHPALKEAAQKAVVDFGTGSGAARLICGSLKIHHQLEDAIARLKRTESALTFSTGYATAVGAITALLGKEDVAIIDKLVHASIVDAVRLSGAIIRVFDHNDPGDLLKILQWADRKRTAPPGTNTQVLIITETVFSMDGDVAPLGEIVELKDRFGAWLMVDEAHATGLFGAARSGKVEEAGMTGRVEVQMGTLGKAIGSAGGYIAGSKKLVDYLVNKARSFIFSTAPVPAQAAAALAGIQLIQSPEGELLAETCLKRVEQFQRELIRERFQHPLSSKTPIQPIIIGQEQHAMAVSLELRTKGILAPAIRYPTVARGKARLRISFSAAHSPQHVSQLVNALGESAATAF